MSFESTQEDQAASVAIRVNDVSKVYRIYAKPHHRLLQRIPTSTGAPRYSEFSALHNVSAEIRRGETVGIVGRNGSGKSTLLQIICETLQPSSGSIERFGRLAALLELGAGFNPEFSGKENVFLNAAVMGISRAEVEERYSDIVAFADIGEHINHPVKTYSSGMYIRLAFAVAICVDPDILVVDEALSVGDEAFQRKCFARIEELKRSGCTILFVSHSASSVVQLCDRALLLDGGQLVATGEPKQIVALYQRLLYAPAAQRERIRQDIQSGVMRADDITADTIEAHDLEDGKEIVPAVQSNVERLEERFEPTMVPESTVEYEVQGARIIDPHLTGPTGQRVNFIVPGREYVYRYRVEFSQAAEDVHFGMMIKSMAGVELFGMSSHAEDQGIHRVEAGMTYEVEYRFMSRFLPGVYFTNAGCTGRVNGEEAKFLHRILDAYMFKIEERQTDRRKAGFFDLSSEPACTIRPVGQLAGAP